MKYSLTAFAVLTIVGFACSSDNTSDKPNVLFVIFDDLNNFTGYLNGHPQASTPNIDALAANSTCFTNAYSNTPMCAPSRASFFTGIYCHVARDFAWNEHSKHEGYKNNKTLITIFNENGYRTAGVGKLLHWNGRQTWDERGYLDGMKNIYGPAVANKETGEMMGLPSVPMPINSYIDGSWGKLVDFESDPENSHLHYVTDWDGKGKFHFKSETDRDQLHDESTTDWAIETIKKWDSTGLEQPFMLGVGFVRPHTPFHVPAKFYDMFPLEDIQLPEFLINDIEDCHYHDITNPESKGIRYYNELKAAYGDIETGLKHYLQGYLASIAFADEQFGKVINVLNNSRFKDNTIIVITSDHGYQIGQKEYLFKNSMWEESCHIPLLVHTPKQSVSQKCKHPVSLIDIFPTFVDLCDLSGDNKWNEKGRSLDGYSLLPFLENPDYQNWDGPEGAFAMQGNTMEMHPTLNTLDKQHFSYRTKKCRYILYRTGKEELYDHDNDPREWYNLAQIDSLQSIRNQLKADLIKIRDKK